MVMLVLPNCPGDCEVLNSEFLDLQVILNMRASAHSSVIAV